jgi:hypothetical protein
MLWEFFIKFVLFSSKSHWMDPCMKMSIALWNLPFIRNNFRWAWNHEGLFVIYFPNSSQLFGQTMRILISNLFFMMILNVFLQFFYTNVCCLWGIFIALLFSLRLFRILASRSFLKNFFPFSNGWIAFSRLFHI